MLFYDWFRCVLVHKISFVSMKQEKKKLIDEKLSLFGSMERLNQHKNFRFILFFIRLISQNSKYCI